MVGALLAQHECVRGLYPLTTAFLDLLLACVTDDLALTRLVRPSVIFIIQVQDCFLYLNKKMLYVKACHYKEICNFALNLIEASGSRSGAKGFWL